MTCEGVRDELIAYAAAALRRLDAIDNGDPPRAAEVTPEARAT